MTTNRKAIASVADRELRWEQVSFGANEHSLAAQGGELARLRFHTMSGTLATAQSADGTWTFKRVGFWQQQATIREAGADHDLAVFRNRTWQAGGTLEFAGGSRFRATTNFWNTRFAFQNEAEETLVQFHYGGAFRLSAAVEITRAARDLPELPLLVLFGWYLCVMLHRDFEMTGAAVVATAG